MDDDEEEKEDPHDTMYNHKTFTADRAYGLTIDILRGLNHRSVAAYRQVVSKWHQFLGVNSRQQTDPLSLVQICLEFYPEFRWHGPSG